MNGDVNNMNRVWAALEMAAAVILMGAMILCLVRIWRQSGELFDSMARSADSYRIVVNDGKEVFEESHKTIPTHIDTLKTISGNLDTFIATCQNTSNTFKKIRAPESKAKWMKRTTSWFNNLTGMLGDFAASPIPTMSQIKKSLDDCIRTLSDIQSEEKRKHICESFDRTADSLESAKETMGRIKNSLRGVIAIFTIIMGICCVGIFCHGLSRWRSITSKAQ